MTKEILVIYVNELSKIAYQKLCIFFNTSSLFSINKLPSNIDLTTNKVIIIDPSEKDLIHLKSKLAKNIKLEIIITNLLLCNQSLSQIDNNISFVFFSRYDLLLTGYIPNNHSSILKQWITQDQDIKIKKFQQKKTYLLHTNDLLYNLAAYYIKQIDKNAEIISIDRTFQPSSLSNITPVFISCNLHYSISDIILTLEMLNHGAIVIAPSLGVFKDLHELFPSQLKLTPLFYYQQHYFIDQHALQKLIFQSTKDTPNFVTNFPIKYKENKSQISFTIKNFSTYYCKDFNQVHNNQNFTLKVFPWITITNNQISHTHGMITLKQGDILLLYKDQKRYISQETAYQLIIYAIAEYRYSTIVKNNQDYFCTNSMQFIDSLLPNKFFIPEFENSNLNIKTTKSDILLLGDFLRSFFEIPHWGHSKIKLYTYAQTTKIIYKHLLGISDNQIALLPKIYQYPCRIDFTDFIYAGRLSPAKNIDTIIHFFYFWQKKINPQATLYLFGEFDNEADLFEYPQHTNYHQYILKIIHSYQWTIPPILMGQKHPSEWTNMTFNQPVYISFSTYRRDDFAVSVMQALNKNWPVIISEWGGHQDYTGKGIYKIPTSFITANVSESSRYKLIKSYIQSYKFSTKEKITVTNPQPIEVTKIFSLYERLRSKYSNSVFLITREDSARIFWDKEGTRFVNDYDYFNSTNRFNKLVIFNENFIYNSTLQQSNLIFYLQKNITQYLQHADDIFLYLEPHQISRLLFQFHKHLQDKKIYIPIKFKSNFSCHLLNKQLAFFEA